MTKKRHYLSSFDSNLFFVFCVGFSLFNNENGSKLDKSKSSIFSSLVCYLLCNILITLMYNNMSNSNLEISFSIIIILLLIFLPFIVILPLIITKVLMYFKDLQS